MTEKLYGFYSSKQAKHNPTCWYEKPDGGKVLVTQVGSTIDPETSWDDFRCVGEVTKFLSVISTGGPIWEASVGGLAGLKL